MSDETHYYGDGHDHGPEQVEAIAQQMRDDAPARQAAADARDAKRETLAIPLHHFTVTLRHGRWGSLEYDLTCPGDESALCHWWQDEEDDPRTWAHHDECAILDWFADDTSAFIEGYAGPARDSLVSGPVEIATWGEDGFEWRYPADPDGQLERDRVRSALAPHLAGVGVEIGAVVDDIMAELAGEHE